MDTRFDVFTRRWNEIVLVFVFAAIVSFQLFVPPFVGMADNADFKKVTGVFCLGPRDGNPHLYGFFVPDLVFAPEYCYYQDQVPSSEWFFTVVAVKLHGLFGGGHNFDIRTLGAVNAFTYIAGFFAILVALRPYGTLLQTLLGVIALWMFTDVLYVAYLNSFYINSAAFLGAFIAVPLAVIILSTRDRPSLPLLVIFTAAVVIFSHSKGQHAFVAWAGSVVLLLTARNLSWPKRAVPLVLAALPLIVSIHMLRSTPVSIRGQTTFNVVMVRLLPHSSAPEQMGRELRLTTQEMKLSGKQVFSPDLPPIDFVSFYHRVFPRLINWYLLHPLQTVHWLYVDLVTEAPRLRFNGGGNYRFEDGKPFGSLTTRFASWSNLKAALIRWCPVALPIWYSLVITASISLLIYPRRGVPFVQVWVLLGIALIAVAEYLVPSLLDAAGETNRHFFLFHALTDFTLLFGAGLVVSRWTSWSTIRIRPREVLNYLKPELAVSGVSPLPTPLEWPLPAAAAACALNSIWNNTPLELQRFTDRTIGTAVLAAYDTRARSTFLIKGFFSIAAIVAVWLLCGWLFERWLAGRRGVGSVSLFRRLLVPANYLALCAIAAMIFQVPVPEWGPPSNIAALFALYFVGAAGWVSATRYSPALTHVSALTALSVTFGLFRLDGKATYSDVFVYWTFGLLALFWVAGRAFVSWRKPSQPEYLAGIKSWLALAAIPLLLLPAAPECAQETAYFAFLRFNARPQLVTVAWFIAVAEILCALAMVLYMLWRRPRAVRSCSWLFSRVHIPLSLAVLVIVCTLIRAGTPVTPDVHHWGEALMPLDQLLKFGSLPYIDFLPGHGVFENLGPLIHRVIYGCYDLDAMLLGATVAIAIGFVSTCIFLRCVFRSPALAFFLPILLTPVIQPSLGYVAPYYGLGLLVILAIGRAVRAWTIRAFVLAGFAALAATTFRLDVGLGTALIGGAVFTVCAIREVRGPRKYYPLAFAGVLAAAAIVYVIALLVRTGGLQRLAVLREFASLDFYAMYAVPVQFLSPLVSRFASNFFAFFLLPASVIGVLMVILRVALAGSERLDRRFLSRAAIVAAAGAYNVLVFNRGLQRFSESLAGGGFLSQYEIAYSFLVIILTAQVLGARKAVLAMLWAAAVVLTTCAVPYMYSQLLIRAVSMPLNPVIERPARMNEFTARIKLPPDLVSDWQSLKQYVDRNVPPQQTFVELSNQPIFHVAFKRRYPAFNIITFAASDEAMQRAYLDQWDVRNVPVVLVRGGEDGLNDIDAVPDPVRNYRLHERLQNSYRRDVQLRQFIMYKRRDTGETGVAVETQVLKNNQVSSIAPGSPLVLATPALTAGPGTEAVVDFKARCHDTIPFRIVFQPSDGGAAGNAEMICGAPGFAGKDEWEEYQTRSPLSFTGAASRVNVDTAATSGLEVRDIGIRIALKGADLDLPTAKAVFDVRWLPYIWGQYDPLHAVVTQPVLWKSPNVPVEIKPGEGMQMNLDLEATPAAYVRVDAAAAVDASLILNYAKEAVPLSTPKGFRFNIHAGRAYYMLRPSVQAYWYGDRSRLRKLVLWNDSKAAVKVLGVAIQRGD